MRFASSVIIVLVLLGRAAEVEAQCTKDIECKGSRLCHHGVCVDPADALASPAPATAPMRAAPAAAVTAPPPASSPGPARTAPVTESVPAETTEAAPPRAEAGALQVRAARPSTAPAAHTGFQLAFRTGYAHPSGGFSGLEGDTMANAFSGQMPLIFDLGWKVSHHWFVGAYAGVGVGGAAGEMSSSCYESEASCVGLSFRLGVLAEYNILPHRRVNPWVGFGFGLEYAGMFWSGQGTSGSISGVGFEIASLMAGLDFRVSPGFGVGPFLAFSAGMYRSIAVDDNGKVTRQMIEEPAWHEWFMVGLRMVFRP